MMVKMGVVAAVLALMTVGAAAAPPTATGDRVNAGPGEAPGELADALTMTGDRTRGAAAYEVCSACRMPSGAGPLIKSYDDRQLLAISAYQASLAILGRRCAATPSAAGKKPAR